MNRQLKKSIVEHATIFGHRSIARQKHFLEIANELLTLFDRHGKENVLDALSAIEQHELRPKRPCKSFSRLRRLVRSRGDCALDHEEAYLDESSRQVLVSHPYDISSEQMKNIVAFCESNGYQARISARSGYYFGHTVRLEFRKC